MTPAPPGLFRGMPLAVVLAYPLLAGEGALRRAAFVVLVVACLGAAASGFACNRPVRPRLWAALLGGQALLGAAAVASMVGDAGTGIGRPPAVADAMRLAGCLLLTIGLLRLDGGRHPTRERGALLDATLVGTAAATVAGVFLVMPASDDPAAGVAQRALAMTGPVAGVLTLAVLTRLVTTRGGRTPAFHLLCASVVALVLAPAVATAVGHAPAAEVPAAVWVLLETVELAGYLLFALAAAHPSMGAPAVGSRDGDERLTAMRLGALGAAMLLTPATLGVQVATGGPRHVPLVAVGSTGVIVLVLVRIRGLLRQVEDQAAQLSHLARADALTGLPNRRSWDFELARAASRAREQGTRLVVALLDLDHFKAFNDSRGHQAGDELLSAAAAAWRDVLGCSGTLARYGGEEFALVRVGGGLPEAVELLERMAAVTPQGQTFSAGLAVWDFLEVPSAAVARADAALYEAKRAGRNRILTAGAGPITAPDLAAPDASAGPSEANRPNG